MSRHAGTLRAWICAVLLWACLTVAAAGAPVRVATFNVMNYLAMDRRIDGRFRPGYPKPEREKKALRDAICEVAPDVLALQEMGPGPYLEELRQDLARGGLVYPHAYLLEAADPDRHLAVLSRLPFVRVTPHASVPFAYLGEQALVKRGLLEVDFASPTGGWTLFVVHLKSRLTERPEDPESADRRVREARALRDVVLARFAEPAAARFVIAGDFNDAKNSRALSAFLRRGRTTISRLVPAADARGDAWTYRHQASDTFSRNDYFLVSAALWPCVAGSQGRVHDGAGSLLGSDHRIVFVSLELDPPAAADVSPAGGATALSGR